MSIIKIATKEDIASLEASKASVASVQALTSTISEIQENIGQVNETVAIANGGTGATTAEQARINLGAAAFDHTHISESEYGAANIIDFRHNQQLIYDTDTDYYIADIEIDFGETTSKHVRIWSNETAYYSGSNVSKSLIMDLVLCDNGCVFLSGIAHDKNNATMAPFVCDDARDTNRVFSGDYGAQIYGLGAFLQNLTSADDDGQVGKFNMRQTDGHLYVSFRVRSNSSKYTNMDLSGVVIND